MRKAFGILLMLVGVPVMTASLFMIAVNSWALNKDFYKGIANDPDLYAFVKSGDFLIEKKDTMDLNGYTLDSNAAIKAMQAAFPESSFKMTANEIIDDVFERLENVKASSDDMTFDLLPLKQDLSSKGTLVSDTYLENVPKSDKLTDPALIKAYIAKKDFSSIPSNLTKEAAIAIKATFETMIKEMPATYTVENSSIKADVDFKSATVTNLPNALAGASYSMLAFALVWFLVSGFIFTREWDERFIFWGASVNISSVLVIVTGVVSMIAINLPAVANFVREPMLNTWLASESGKHLMAFFSHSVGKIASGFFITGVVAMSLGFGLISMKWIGAKQEI